MIQGFWGDDGSGGGGGGVTSFNGQTGAVTYPTVIQEDCPDNTTTQIVLGLNTLAYEVFYQYALNVSNKKIEGKLRLAVDGGGIIEDHQYSFNTSDIAGLTIAGNNSGGNIRIGVTLAAVGENSKFRYVVLPISPIV